MTAIRALVECSGDFLLGDDPDERRACVADPALVAGSAVTTRLRPSRLRREEREARVADQIVGPPA